MLDARPSASEQHRDGWAHLNTTTSSATSSTKPFFSTTSTRNPTVITAASIAWIQRFRYPGPKASSVTKSSPRNMQLNAKLVSCRTSSASSRRLMTFGSLEPGRLSGAPGGDDGCDSSQMNKLSKRTARTISVSRTISSKTDRCQTGVEQVFLSECRTRGITEVVDGRGCRWAKSPDLPECRGCEWCEDTTEESRGVRVPGIARRDIFDWIFRLGFVLAVTKQQVRYRTSKFVCLKGASQ